MRLVNNPKNYKKTKYIDIKYHYIKELIKQGILILAYL